MLVLYVIEQSNKILMNKVFNAILMTLFLAGPAMSQSSYFHELKGMEDSTGTTHLFYRLFLPDDDEFENLWTDNSFHFDTFTKSDSVIFESINQFPLQVPKYILISDFLFLDNDLQKPFWVSNRDGSWSNLFSNTYAYNESFFHAGPHWGDKIRAGKNDSLSFTITNLKDKSALVILNNDSLPSIKYDYPVLVKLNLDEEFCEGSISDCYLGASDSVRFLDYNLLDIDSFQPDKIFLSRNDSLFVTQNLGDSITYLNSEFNWSNLGSFEFGKNGSTIIATTENRFRINEQDNSFSNYQLLQSLDAGLTWTELANDTSRIYVSKLSESTSLDFYVGIGASFFYWNQLLNKFLEVTTFESSITGMYGEQDSGIIYILTEDELLEWSDGVFISLKKLGVSIAEVEEIPNSIVLHQNYPNPFNPNTTISFELDKPAEVTLTVFDALGRTVSTLIHERRPAGIHQIPFDASGLSSGIYFYQLETGNLSLTKKLTLIK